MRILIVDDEPAIVSALVEWLTARGHEAAGTTRSLGLPGWVVKQQYDVVFIDVYLRDTNGLWLISQVHAAAPATTIFVMSGNNDPCLAEIALNEGARYYFKKPFDLGMLDRALQEVIDEKSPPQRAAG